jgi:hypothetical protein
LDKHSSLFQKLLDYSCKKFYTIGLEGAGEKKPQAQEESHGHGHNSDDPLAWLRESVPGKNYIFYL